MPTIFEIIREDFNSELDAIHNENNMRPNELNAMFKVSGLNDVCSSLCKMQAIKDYFMETETGKTHGKLIKALEEFMERRNNIAHALNPGSSAGPDQIIKDLDMLAALSTALCLTLDAEVLALPQPAAPSPSGLPAMGSEPDALRA